MSRRTPTGPNGHPITDHMLLIPMGIYPGISNETIFGTNLTVPTTYELVWSGEQVWSPLPAATTLEIASTNVNDTAAGTGAQMVLLTGLDENWLDQEEFVVMNGQTPVLTTGIYRAVNRLLVVTAGSSGFNEGILCVADDSTDWTAGVPDDVTSLQGKITAEHSITQEAIFTVPANKTAYVVNHTITAASNLSVTFQTVGLNNETGVEIVALEGEITNTTSHHPFLPYATVPGKFTFYTRAKVSASTGVISASWGLILVEDREYSL